MYSSPALSPAQNGLCFLRKLSRTRRCFARLVLSIEIMDSGFGSHLITLGGTVIVGNDEAIELNPYTAQLLRAGM